MYHILRLQKESHFYSSSENIDGVMNFLVINMKGTPEWISTRIADCFPRISNESPWKDPSFNGFDIIDDILIWNDEIISWIELDRKLASSELKDALLMESRNSKIDSIDNI